MQPTVPGEGMLGDVVPGRPGVGLRLHPLCPVSTMFVSGVDVDVGATRVQDCTFGVDSGRLQKLIDMNDCVHNQSDGQQHFYLT